jgi:hypothetical protein
LVEVGVGEHASDARLQVCFQEVDAPEVVVAGVEKDAMGMIAPRAATLTVGVWRSQRSGTNTANLSSLPHPRRRCPLSAHWQSLGETAKRHRQLVVEGSEGTRDCGFQIEKRFGVIDWCSTRPPPALLSRQAEAGG